jgi:hypothetical protein
MMMSGTQRPAATAEAKEWATVVPEVTVSLCHEPVMTREPDPANLEARMTTTTSSRRHHDVPEPMPNPSVVGGTIPTTTHHDVGTAVPTTDMPTVIGATSRTREMLDVEKMTTDTMTNDIEAEAVLLLDVTMATLRTVVINDRIVTASVTGAETAGTATETETDVMTLATEAETGTGRARKKASPWTTLVGWSNKARSTTRQSLRS